MKRVLIPLFFLQLLTLSGCMQELYSKVEKPAKASLPLDSKKILLVQEFMPSFRYNQKAEVVYQEGSVAALQGAQEVLSSSLALPVEVADTAVVASLRNGNKRINSNVAKALCAHYQASAVLVLNQVSAGKKNSYAPNDGLYTPSFDMGFSPQGGHTGNGSIHYLALQSKWTLLGSDGSLFDSAEVLVRKPYILTEEMSKGLSIGKMSIANAGKTFNWAAQTAGQTYAQRFLKQATVIHKPYYHTAEMAPAAEWIKVRNWEEAAALLLPLTNNPSASIASKAAYNLAVICEAQGLGSEAQAWAEIAATKGDKKAKKMIAGLNKPSK